MYSVRCLCSILTKMGRVDKFLMELHYIVFKENPFYRTDGQTYRQRDGTILIGNLLRYERA
jgi:hypothetical protein